MSTIREKITDFAYRMLLQKGHLAVRQEAYNQGFSHGIADAEYWHADSENAKKELEKLRSAMDASWFVDPEKVLTVTKTGIVKIGGEQASMQEINNLKVEVRAIRGMKFYELMQSTLRQEAIKKAVLNSTDLYSQKGNEQVLAGKMMVFCLDTILSMVSIIDNVKI